MKSNTRSGDWTERRVVEECAKAFGDRRFVVAFWDYGRQKFCVGRFVSDADRYQKHPHTGAIRPTPGYKRAQVIYGEGDSWEEACWFLRTGKPMAYLAGYTPQLNKLGHVVAYKSPQGLRVNRIPVPETVA